MVDIYKFLFLSYSKSVQGQFALTRFSEKQKTTKKSGHKVINSGFHGKWSFPHNTASHERKWGFESCCHGDSLLVSSLWTHFPLSYDLFLSDGGTISGGKNNNKKTNVCSNPLRASIPHMFSLYTLPSSLHCCWLLTASVLCDDGAFCCFWGCGLSCCWCLWWWDCCCCCCCCCGCCCCCCSCCCCCGCVAWVKVPCCWSGKAACRISCVDWLLWRRRGPWQQDNAMILDNEGNSSPSAHSLESLKAS